MSGAVLWLVACYAILAVLLLSLNLRSAWHWTVKAAAIGLTAGFFVIAFLAIQGLLGWPAEVPPPARFQLHGAVVLEPDRNRPRGAIYLWLSPRAPDGDIVGPPRAHALPYTRELHEQTERARQGLRDGRAIEGTAGRDQEAGEGSMQVRLYEGPPPVLPPKNG
jgi:hypothetical protein